MYNIVCTRSISFARLPWPPDADWSGLAVRCCVQTGLQVYWLDEPEGGELIYGGHNAGGTGRWSDFVGGICSGRQAPYGFWCSLNNTRSQFANDFQVGEHKSERTATPGNMSMFARLLSHFRVTLPRHPHTLDLVLDSVHLLMGAGIRWVAQFG